MGFLDRLKGKGKEAKQDAPIAAYEKMVELFDVDAQTREKLMYCIHDSQAYYNDNAEAYNERGVASNTDDDTIIWLGIVDILMAQGKLFEFDYSVELEDFLYGIRKIKNNDALVIDEDCLDEDSDITEWLGIIGNEWEKAGYVVAGMDIASDSYCVFIAAKDAFDKLVTEAEKTGHKIVLAQDM